MDVDASVESEETADMIADGIVESWAADDLCWCGDGEAHVYAPGSCRADRAPDSIASPDAQGEQEGAEARTDSDAEDKPAPAVLFGGLGASEAARLRWERVRARENDAEAQAIHEAGDEAVLIRVSVQTGAIIKRLAKDAKAGNVQAARELRSWLNEVAQDAETSVSALDKRTRQTMLARLVAEIEEEDAQGAREDADEQDSALGGTGVASSDTSADGVPPPRA